MDVRVEMDDVYSDGLFRQWKVGDIVTIRLLDGSAQKYRVVARHFEEVKLELVENDHPAVEGNG